jgi:hypothetical protein
MKISDLSKFRVDITDEIYDTFVVANSTLHMNGHYYCCKTCYSYLKKKKCPSTAVANQLYLDSIPDELKITEMENQLIAKDLLFMKISQLPKSRLEKIVDKVINVPIEDVDIEKTIASFPRLLSDSQVQFVRLKRKQQYKNSHIMEFIRPNMLRKALLVLKELCNPYYVDVKINNDDIFDGDAEECSENLSSSSESDGIHSDNTDNALESVKKYQAKLNFSTCFIPENPEEFVFFNDTQKNVKKKLKHQSEGIEIFPGDGRIPCNWLKEQNFDCKSFPMLFPTGRFGLNENRTVKLFTQQYFYQRVLNIDRRFSKCDSFIFAAQQRVERESLESQFNISFLKGKIKENQNGESTVYSNDFFEIFKHIRGSPKYWHAMRSDIMAKINQLGPFHVFFTLSCAELRWPEIVSAILQLDGNTVEINCVHHDIIVKVNGLFLDEYIKVKSLNLHELIRKNIVLVIRMFDNRLKKFITEILFKNWCKLSVEYFTYRIEFQLRGLPHAHGVIWFNDDDIKKYYIKDTRDFDESKLTSLIDNFITCEIPDSNEKLKQIVLDVQKHNHTKKCLQNSHVCKYKFPRFPSKRTIISKPFPLDESCISDEEKFFLTKRTTVLNNVVIVLTNAELFDTCHSIDDVLELVDCSYEDYEKFISISDVGTNIILKRTIHEIYINNYNKYFLEAWNANLDVQFCTDPYAVITYITDYFTKSEKNLTSKLLDAYKSSRDHGERQSKTFLKNTYITHREISICEAIYRLIPSLLMKNSNIKAIFLNSSRPSQRPCFLKNINNFAKAVVNVPKLLMQGRQGEYVKLPSIHEIYALRPESLNICLAQFTILYGKCYTKPKSLVIVNGVSEIKCLTANIIDGTPLPKYVEIQNTLYMAKNRHSVLRFHKFDEIGDKMGFVYSRMLMFLPWRSEQKDLHCEDMEKCLEEYEKFTIEIEHTRKVLFPFTTSVQIIENTERNNIFQGLLLDNEGVRENDECIEMPTEDFNFRHPGKFENFNEAPGI